MCLSIGRLGRGRHPEMPACRRPDPHLASGHRSRHDGTHADDGPGPHHDLLADESPGANIGAASDRDAAGDACSRAEGDAIADHVVVGQHNHRHDRDVSTELDVRGKDGERVENRSRTDGSGLRNDGSRMNKRGIAFCRQLEARDERKSPHRIGRRRHARRDERYGMVMHGLCRAYHGDAMDQAPMQASVVVKQADHLPRGGCPVDSTHQLQRLTRESACTDQEKPSRSGQLGAPSAASASERSPWRRPRWAGQRCLYGHITYSGGSTSAGAWTDYETKRWRSAGRGVGPTRLPILAQRQPETCR